MSKYLFTFLLYVFLKSNSGLEAQDRSLPQINYIPELLQEFVITLSNDIPYLEIPDYSLDKPSEFISKAQAIEDINSLRYILDYGYCGRYYWEQNGVNFTKLYSDLREFVQSNRDSVSVKEFENILIRGLSNLNDGHSKVIGFKTTEFAKSRRAYFAEIVLEKHGNEYIVIQSKQEGVNAGMKYLDSEKYLFPTLSPVDKKCYIIGKLSFDIINKMNLNFNRETKSITLHRCRISEAKNSYMIFDNEKKDSITIIRASRFDDQYGKVLEKFSSFGKTAKNEKIIIFNLINNDGGNALFPRQFIENLNTNAKGFDYMATLHSPAVNQAYMPGKNLWLNAFRNIPNIWLRKDVDFSQIPSEIAELILGVRKENAEFKKEPKQYWEIIKNDIPESGTYKGKFYTIINSRVGSAAINATAFTKSIPNNILIGENTSGGYTFGEVIYYNLEHSKIKLKLPQKIVVNRNFNYERGFLPDYWLDSAEPEKEIVEWINDPGNYLFKY